IGASATIEAWVQFNALTAGSLYTIASKDVGSNTNNKWIFGYSNNYSGNGTVTIFHINTTSSGSIFLKSNSWTPTPGTWYHLAVVKTGNNSTFYRNGVADGTATTTIAVPDVATTFQVGRAEGPFYFNGQIDDLRLWNTARAATDISGNMNTPLSGSETGLAG